MDKKLYEIWLSNTEFEIIVSMLQVADKVNASNYQIAVNVINQLMYRYNTYFNTIDKSF